MGNGFQKPPGLRRIIKEDIWDKNHTQSGRPHQDKIDKGWVAGEKPPHTAFNWMDNLVTENMLDFSELGILPWHKAVEYKKFSICNYKGHLFQASGPNKDIEPESPADIASDTWKLATTPMAANQMEIREPDMIKIRDDKMITPRNLRIYLESIGIDIPATHAINHIVFNP